MDRLIARGYCSAANVRGKSFPPALLKAASHLHYPVRKARRSRFLVKAADFLGIADDDPSWVQWWIVDLSGKESPRKNLSTAQQHVQETEELQERMIHTGFSKEELRVVVRHRILMVDAQFSPAKGELSNGWERSAKLFELRFPLPENASTQQITARLKGNVLCITVPKKNAQAAEATVTHDFDDIDVEVTEML